MDVVMVTDDELLDTVDRVVSWTRKRMHDGLDDGETSQTDSCSSLEKISLSDEESLNTLVVCKQSGRRSKSRASCRLPRRNRDLPYTRSKDRWRLRPKDELEYLRTKVVELEKLAKELRISDLDPKLINEEKSRPCVVWRQRAKSQSAQLGAVMEENQKLRAMVYGRMQISRALESAIDQHVKSMAQQVPWPTIVNGKPTANLSDELIFALLDEDIMDQLAATEDVMEISGITRVHHQLLTTLQFQENARGPSFHHSEVRVLPYSVMDVTRALQNCLSHGVALKSCRKIVKRGNGFNAVVVDSVQTPGSHLVEVKARHSQRCYVEADRAVITWSSYMEYKGPHFLRLLNKIWVCLEPIYPKMENAPPTERDTPGTRLRVVVKITPTEAGVSAEEMTRIKEMADIVILAHHQGADMVHQNIMDQLKISSGGF